MIRRLVLLGIASWLSASPSFGQMSFPSNLIPTRTALGRVGLEKNWYAVVPLAQGGGERVVSVSHAGGQVFAQTNYAYFHSFDGETGRLNWTTRLGMATPTSFPASSNSNSIFVTNFQDLFSLDKATGAERFKVRLEATPSSGTAADDDRVTVGLANGKLLAYSARDRRGEQPPGPKPGGFEFAWSTNKAMLSQPMPASRLTAFGSQDGKLYVALNNPNLILYRFLTAGPITAPLGAYGMRSVIIASTDHNVYSVDLFNGNSLWTVPTGGPITNRPLVAGEDVFVVNTTGLLVCIDGKSGQTRWTRRAGEGARLLSVGVSKVYLFSQDRDLIVVDRAAGAVVLRRPEFARPRPGVNLREFSIFRTNPEDDRLFFATPSGFLLSLREIGATKPRLLRDPKLKEFGYLPPEGEPVSAPATPTPAAGAEPTPAAEPAQPPN